LIATFSLQLGPARYRFFARPPVQLAFARGQTREQQLRGWVETYVLELEALVRQYPYQWFNFYDFWDSKPPTLTPARETEAAAPGAEHPQPGDGPGPPVPQTR
jgi:hypothetical protein